MMSDSDVILKLHIEAIAFLENEREDDDEEAVQKYFKTFHELFELIRKYGMKIPSHIVDRITIQQFIILKKCGANVTNIQKLISPKSVSIISSESENEEEDDDDTSVKPRIIMRAENPFVPRLQSFNNIVPNIPGLPNLNMIPPLSYINPIPSPKIPDLPNFKSVKSDDE
jgi:hypothetical protein